MVYRRPKTVAQWSFVAIAAVAAAALAVLVVWLAARSHRATGVFAVKHGMTKPQVQKIAGTPYRAGPNCWLYRAAKEGTSIDGMRYCFTKGRISLIQTAVHG